MPMTLSEMLALLPDNATGLIGADDMRTITTELYNRDATAGGAVSSVNGKTGAVTLTKSDISLPDVDNTSDLNKPLSVAAVEALAYKAPLASPTFSGTVRNTGQYLTEKVDGEAATRRRTNYTGTLATTLTNASEFYVNGVMKSWQNEWGAYRGVSPYVWGDAIFRAIRQDGDGITGGVAFELSDRRTGVTQATAYGRRWTDANLIRNGVVMADTYVTTYADPTQDPNYANLPSGTNIVVRAT